MGAPKSCWVIEPLPADDRPGGLGPWRPQGELPSPPSKLVRWHAVRSPPKLEGRSPRACDRTDLQPTLAAPPKRRIHDLSHPKRVRRSDRQPSEFHLQWSMRSAPSMPRCTSRI